MVDTQQVRAAVSTFKVRKVHGLEVIAKDAVSRKIAKKPRSLHWAQLPSIQTTSTWSAAAVSQNHELQQMRCLRLRLRLDYDPL